jgi:anaerobic magnesium-protoporphyrin IX monomethyl ester cyclase
MVQDRRTAAIWEGRVSKVTDVLFGQSYFLIFDPKLWRAMQPYPPLGTMYAASVARDNGYSVALFDAMLAASEEEWAHSLDEHQPAFAVIYEDSFNYLTKMCLLRMREAAFTMIKMAASRGISTIVCGSDATDHTEAYLNQGANYVILGEGEVTLIELLDNLSGRSDTSIEEILGIAYLNREGTVSGQLQVGEIEGRYHKNPPRPDIKEPDELPFPAWDLVDVDRYKEIWLDRHGYYSMNMVTTRGCPFHCNWCAKPIWGQRYNSRSPENVADELKWLKAAYEPDHIWFADDIFGLKPGWWRRFADLVEEQNSRLPFKCLSRADLILRNADDVHALRRAGCDIVWMGAESGSQKILDAMEKGTTVEQIYEAVRRLQEGGIRVALFLQFGYPGENREDIERTLTMVRETMPDDVGMSVSYPLPGTRFYDNVSQQMGEKRNWSDSSDLAMMYEGPFSTEFYRQLHVVLHKEFRSRKGLRELRGLFSHPTRVKQKHIREAFAIVYRLGTLPVERFKLNRLARQPRKPADLLPHMAHQEAAQPTPQE